MVCKLNIDTKGKTIGKITPEWCHKLLWVTECDIVHNIISFLRPDIRRNINLNQIDFHYNRCRHSILCRSHHCFLHTQGVVGSVEEEGSGNEDVWSFACRAWHVL